MPSKSETNPPCASFRTQFFNVSNKCLLFHYRWVYSGSMTIFLRNDDRDLEVLTNISSRADVQELSGTWHTLFLRLPLRKNLRQIVFKGNRISGELSGVALDDLTIRPCTDFSKWSLVHVLQDAYVRCIHITYVYLYV